MEQWQALNPFTGNPGQPADVHSVLPQPRGPRVYPRLTVRHQIPPWVNPQLPVKGLKSIVPFSSY